MKKLEQSLDNFSKLINELKKNRSSIPFKKYQDRYELFDCYMIKPYQGGYAVTNKYEDVLYGVFSSKVSATSWCILEQNNRHTDACELKNTDDVYSRMVSNLVYCKHHARGSAFKITLQESRHTEYVVAKKQHKRKLNKLINLAKYIQSKGLQHETSRSHTR